MAISLKLARDLMAIAPEALIGWDTQGLETQGERLPDPGPVSTSGILQLRLGDFKTNRRHGQREQLDAYRGWVAAAVNLISNDIRQANWNVGRFLDDRRTKFEPIPFESVPPVLRRPMRQLTMGALLELTTKHLDSTGQAFWHIVTSGGERELGRVDAIQPIYPHWVQEPIWDNAARRFTGWRVCPPGGQVTDMSFDDVIWFYRPHPVEAWRAASPIEQVAATIDFDLYTKAYSADLMESGGIPPGILSLEQKVDQDTADLIKARWRQTRQSPDDISVVGNGASYEVTGTKLGDLEFLQLSRMNRDEVLAIYGVPAAKLGLVEDVNRGAEAQTDRSYAKNVLRPRMTLIAEPINIFLLPLLGLEAGLEFHFDDPVPEDREFKLQRANDGLKAGALTVREYLEETGREVDDDETESDRDVFLLPSNVTVKDALEESEPPAIPPVGPPRGPRQDDDPPPPRGERNIIVVSPGQAQAVTDRIDEHTHVCGGTDDGLRALIADLELEDLERRDVVEVLQTHGFLPYDLPLSKLDRENAGFRFALEQDRIERALLSDLRARFSAEQRQVVKRIRDLKNLPEIRVRAGEQMPDRDYHEWRERGFVDDPELAMWLDILLPETDLDEVHRHDLLRRVFGQQTKSWIRTIRNGALNGIRKGWDLFRRDVRRDMIDIENHLDRIERDAQRTGESQLRMIRSTTRRAIAEAARQASVDRLTVAGFANVVNALYDRWKGPRSQTIAGTVAAQAINRGHELHGLLAERRLQGFRVRNTWTAIFVNTRGDHADADGQRQFVGDKFAVGGEQMERPLDPNASARNVVNCQCFLVAEVVRDRDAAR